MPLSEQSTALSSFFFHNELTAAALSVVWGWHLAFSMKELNRPGWKAVRAGAGRAAGGGERALWALGLCSLLLVLRPEILMVSTL